MPHAEPMSMLFEAMPPTQIARALSVGSASLDNYLGERIYCNTDPDYLVGVRRRLADTALLHAERVGDAPAVLLRAPGRLNAFLEYLDMCAGDHMSTTIDGDMPVCVSVRDDDIVRCSNVSDEFPSDEFSISREMELFRSAKWSGPACEGLEDNWDNRTRIYPYHGHSQGDWLNYVRGAFLRVAWELPGVRLRGVDMTFGESSIPLRGGVSSSSALVVLSFLALYVANKDRLPAWDIQQVCRMLGEAEWYVGTHGGANDQTTILRNKPNCVLYNRHSQPELDSTVLPSLRGVKFVVAHSLWEANKATGANHVFNLRKGWMDLGDDLLKLIIDAVTEHIDSGGDIEHGWLCALLERRFGYVVLDDIRVLENNLDLWPVISRNYRKFGSLDQGLLGVPDPAIDALVNCLPEEIGPNEAAWILGKDQSAMERDYTVPYPEEGGYRPRAAARFFAKENRIGRTLERIFLEAESRLISGEIGPDSSDYEAYRMQVGKLLEDLQDTLRDDFHVSNSQLDLMLDIARRGPGYIGGKLTGAGSGGCIAVMVRDGNEREFCDYLDREYYAKPENFARYRERIFELPLDVADALSSTLDSALANPVPHRRVVTFSAGAGPFRLQGL